MAIYVEFELIEVEGTVARYRLLLNHNQSQWSANKAVKRILSRFAGLLVILSITACSSGQTDISNTPNSTKEIDLQKYQGSWIDKDLNLFTYSDSENSLYIFTEDGSINKGSISLYLYNPEPQTDSIATFQLKGNEAGFAFEDETGKGQGNIVFLKDEVHIKLNLESKADEVLRDIYSKERIFVRKPYEGLIIYDPLEIIRDYLHMETINGLEINKGAEWNEELEAGREIEVVNRINEAGEVIEMYKVNTLNKAVIEIEM